MLLIEVLFISLFSLIQSIFGVGLLLLGTPTFLLLGYNYFEVLNILLPYSILISILQIFFNKDKMYGFGIQILKYSIPTLILGLIIVNYLLENINFLFFISFVLIAFSIINLMNLRRERFKIKNLNIALIMLGLVHGLSNLGGTLLSIIASNVNKDKFLIRNNIATGYFLFASFQILVVNVFFVRMNFDYLKFLWIPIVIYFTSQFIFKKIKNILFYKILNLFTLIYGVYIFFSNLG